MGVKKWIAIVLCAVALGYLAKQLRVLPYAGQDFRAFYCGARVMIQRQDPYRFGPLVRCEYRYGGSMNVVVPDPLPSYAIAAFTPLARLDFETASFIWFILIVLSGLVVTAIVSELTALPVPLVAVFTLPTLWVGSIEVGSLAPVVIALLCGAAAAVARAQGALAAVLVACACIEPHVALPAAIATFICCRQSRVPLVVAGVILAVISAASVGVTVNAEYASQVLPAHAVSELSSRYQYGLSSALYLFGVPERVAVLLGAVQYILFAVVGVAIGYSMKAKFAAAPVLVPIAFAVGGGSFVHPVEIAAALPLALLLAARLKGVVSWVAPVLLAVPWYDIVEPLSRRMGVDWPITLGVSPAPNGALAEVVWKQWMTSTNALGVIWYVEHVPLYLGLALVYFGAIKYAGAVTWRLKRRSSALS